MIPPVIFLVWESFRYFTLVWEFCEWVLLALWYCAAKQIWRQLRSRIANNSDVKSFETKIHEKYYKTYEQSDVNSAYNSSPKAWKFCEKEHTTTMQLFGYILSKAEQVTAAKHLYRLKGIGDNTAVIARANCTVRLVSSCWAITIRFVNISYISRVCYGGQVRVPCLVLLKCSRLQCLYIA